MLKNNAKDIWKTGVEVCIWLNSEALEVSKRSTSSISNDSPPLPSVSNPLRWKGRRRGCRFIEHAGWISILLQLVFWKESNIFHSVSVCWSQLLQNITDNRRKQEKHNGRLTKENKGTKTFLFNTFYVITKLIRVLWLVNQLWFIHGEPSHLFKVIPHNCIAHSK